MDFLRDGREVKFLGGPLDGHLAVLCAPLAAFVAVKLPQLTWWARIVGWWSRKRTVRVSVYELEVCGECFVYRYLRTQSLRPSSLNRKRPFIAAFTNVSDRRARQLQLCRLNV